MSRFHRIVLAVFIFALLLGPGAVQASRHDASITLEAIDQWVAQKARESTIPGIAYGIVEGGQIVHLNAYGIAGADGRPMTPQTPTAIASVGKTMTALAVQQLVQTGRLDPNAPVRAYLPWFKLADEEAAARLTVQDLLEHKSGLSTLDGNDPVFFEVGVSAEDLVRRMEKVNPNRPAGSTYQYCNLNYLVLGAVIEAASGMSYSDYMQARIFTPLEMRHSFASQDAAEAAGAAEGYRYYYGIRVPEYVAQPQGAMAAGMHYSSAEDMARYLIAFSSHGEYQGKSIVNPGGAPGAARTTYDIDWLPMSPGAANTIGHSGGWLNYSSGILVMPYEGIGVVVLANARPDQLLPARSAFDIAYDVLRLYTGNPVGPARLPLPTLYLILDAALLALAGLAAWRWRSLRKPAGAVGLLIDLAVPALLLTVLPMFFAGVDGEYAAAPWWNWKRLFFSVPDLAAAWLAIAFAWLAAGLVKAWRSIRGGRGGIPG